jgi:hypothetical protein
VTTVAEPTELGPIEAVEFYLPIIKEYTDKLTALCDHAYEVIVSLRTVYAESAVAEAVRLIDWFECMKPVMEKLMRRTASLLDHASLGDELTLLLTLRQEELEANLRHAPAVLGRLEAEFGSKTIRPLVEKSHFTPLRA